MVKWNFLSFHFLCFANCRWVEMRWWWWWSTCKLRFPSHQVYPILLTNTIINSFHSLSQSLSLSVPLSLFSLFPYLITLSLSLSLSLYIYIKAKPTLLRVLLSPFGCVLLFPQSTKFDEFLKMKWNKYLCIHIYTSSWLAQAIAAQNIQCV